MDRFLHMLLDGIANSHFQWPEGLITTPLRRLILVNNTQIGCFTCFYWAMYAQPKKLYRSSCWFCSITGTICNLEEIPDISNPSKKKIKVLCMFSAPWI